MRSYVRFSNSSFSSPLRSHETVDASVNEDYFIQLLNSETVEVLRRSGGGEKSKILNFERCFDDSVDSDQIYQEVMVPLLSQCLQGVDGTVFTCQSPFSVSCDENSSSFDSSNHRWHFFINEESYHSWFAS